jgi:hypothetical protein
MRKASGHEDLFKGAVLIVDAVGERERHPMPVLRWQLSRQQTPQDRQGHDQQHGKDSSAPI